MIKPLMMLWVGASFTGVAHADDALAWRWPDGEERKYRLKADIQLPTAMFFMSDNNRDVRVFDVAFAMDLKCKPIHVAKKSMEVACAVTDTQWIAGADRGDAGRVVPVLDEWDNKLTDGAVVRFTINSAGRVRSVDVDGMAERNQRMRLVKETIRLFVMRAVSGFDLDLPKDGAIPDGAGKEGSPMVANLPVITGLAGNVSVENQVVGRDGDAVTVESVGRAMLTVQSQVDGGPRAPDSYDLEVRSSAVFDVAQGLMVSRTALVTGEMTPGSGSAMGTVAAPYVQGLELTYIPAGTPISNLGPNAERPLK